MSLFDFISRMSFFSFLFKILPIVIELRVSELILSLLLLFDLIVDVMSQELVILSCAELIEHLQVFVIES